MSWLKRVLNILKREPETWLAYLHGQQFDKLNYLQETKARYSGWYLRVAIWFYSLIKGTRFKRDSCYTQCEYLVFVGTENQKKALDSTVLALRDHGLSVFCVAPRKILSEEEIENETYNLLEYSVLDVLKSVLLSLLRIKELRRQLKNKSNLLRRNWLDVFLSTYNFSVYFDALLVKVSPRIVVVSNDHSTPNKTLIALVRDRKEVKVAYMQHASVSNLFPALNFDYAFLDGESALNVYRKCEDNRPVTTPLLKSRRVFLTGQKKELGAGFPNIEDKKNVIGIALNALDSIKAVKELITTLTNRGLLVKLRWHPGLPVKTAELLKSDLMGNKIEFSNPKIESLSEFFSSINCMIAGNSSIHLEAALSNVVPIYYEMSDHTLDDYYGYIKNGVAIDAKSIGDLANIIGRVESRDLKINKEAIQFYSSTFGTEWEGREGKLVSETLLSLHKNLDPPVSAIDL